MELKGFRGDIFDFIKAYYDCSFKEAKQKLEDSDYEVHSFNTKVKKAPYQYQKENEVPVSVAKSYLVNERRIDTALVEDFLSKGLIKQDKKEMFCSYGKRSRNRWVYGTRN